MSDQNDSGTSKQEQQELVDDKVRRITGRKALQDVSLMVEGIQRDEDSKKLAVKKMVYVFVAACFGFLFWLMWLML